MAEDKYVELARKTIENYIVDGELLQVPAELPDEMLRTRAGAFVSLAQEIICNAISAATSDPRFEPVRKDELEDLEISVDVLKEAEKIESLAQLDVKRYGVIVTKGWRRGLLLPDLDGVDTPLEQVQIALMKAGLSQNEKGYTLERFEGIRHT